MSKKIKHLEQKVAALVTENRAKEKKMEKTLLDIKEVAEEIEAKGKNKSIVDMKEYACKLCEKTFEDKRTLNDHVKQEHRKQLECKVCNETFQQAYKLELHLKNHEVETYQCDMCEKTFHLEWRLKKHRNAHNLVNVKFCHYFNNRKQCPYEEIGCMFKHLKAEFCRFKNYCQNKLCQFQHNSKEEGNNGFDKTNDNKETVNNVDIYYHMRQPSRKHS